MFIVLCSGFPLKGYIDSCLLLITLISVLGDCVRNKGNGK